MIATNASTTATCLQPKIRPRNDPPTNPTADKGTAKEKATLQIIRVTPTGLSYEAGPRHAEREESNDTLEDLDDGEDPLTGVTEDGEEADKNAVVTNK